MAISSPTVITNLLSTIPYDVVGEFEGVQCFKCYFR